MPITAINWQDPGAKISKYFTVGEVTKGDAARIPPAGSAIERNILTLASELDQLRENWGKPVLITSWYRPAAINRAVGGAKNSQHTTGGAADIRPVSPGELLRFQSWCDAHWFGALGYGARRGFVHLDIRNGSAWKTGGTKGPRWNY
jgi:putative chitinase